MTVDEKREKVRGYCFGVNCDNCALDEWCNDNSIDSYDEAALDKAIAMIPDLYEPVTNNVEHPSHYNREGALECIDEMVLVFGKEATINFCLLNAWKYRYRAADKNGEEDLKKSDWYIKKCEELRGEM